MTNDDVELNNVLRQIFAGGKVHNIVWGWDDPASDAHDWSIEHKLKYACSLASSMNQAADTLQKERVELFERIALLEKKVEAADELRSIDNDTLTVVITKNNAENQESSKLIQELQARVITQDAVIEALNGNDG